MRVRRSVVMENSTYTVSLSNRPAIIHRGNGGSAYIHIHGNAVRVRIAVSSTDSAIIVLDIVPNSGVTPFTSRVDIYASPTARVGTYHLEATIIHASTGTRLAQTIIPVFVVDDGVLVDVLENIDEYRRIYQMHGAQYAVLKIMADYNLKPTFTHLKLLYEALLGRRISNGTVGDLLSRLLKKGLLVKIGDKYCFNKKLDLETAETIIDIKRATNGIKGAEASSTKSTRSRKEITSKLPKSVEKVLIKASELIKEDYWRATDLVAHTLIGVRETGIWLLWLGDYFIYRESKSEFLHYFISKSLAELLKSIGLKEGFMYRHVNSPAKDLIRVLYRSYANARRLHYLLKEYGWFEYEEPLILELSSDTDSLYIAVKKLYTGEALMKIGEPADSVKKYLVYPGEHVDEENEETYFHRPSGLY